MPKYQKVIHDGVEYERKVGKGGYCYIRVDGKWKSEHRWMLAQELGRPLREHETVHHRNGQPGDNSRSNLELWTTPQPMGKRVDDLVGWVVEEYEDLVWELLTKDTDL